jgi:hypothetical protein
VKLASAFGLLAFLLLVPGLPEIPPGPVRLWLGIASLVLSLLYILALWPERNIGLWLRSASPLAGATRVLLAPHRWGAWLFLLFKYHFRGERHLDEIVPGLYLGRRPLRGDTEREDRAAIDGLVDLCVEFPPSAPVYGVAADDYLSIPALDGTAPSLDDLKHAVAWLEEKLAAGRKVLVHCAAGHGRSATIVACLLIARGLAVDADSAERLMKAVRPLVSLNRSQRAQVARYTASLAGAQ